MAPSRAAARMQPVEILDEDSTSASSSRPHYPHHPRLADDSTPGDTRPPVDLRRAFRRWWPLLVVVVLVVVAAAFVVERRDRERSDRIGSIPGMVRPLGSAPAVRWQVAVAESTDVLAAGGAVVLVSAERQDWRVTSRDASTGAERWSVLLAPTDSSAMQGGQVACPHSAADVGDVLVCVRTPGMPVYELATDSAAASTRGVEVIALAAEDGRELGEWAAPGTVIAMARAGADVVLATAGEDGHVEVVRRAAITGDVTWAYRSRDELQDPSIDLDAAVEITTDLAFLGHTSTAVLDLADGRELFYAAPLTFVIAGPADQGFGTWSPARGGTMHGADGSSLFEIPGLPVRTRVSDGSRGNPVVLDLGRQLIGHDLESGQQLWSTVTDLDPALVVDHRMVLAHEDRLGVIDLRTGVLMWDRALDHDLPWQPISDGALVLAPATAHDGSPELAGYGLGDGVPSWSVSIPDDVLGIEAQGGHLLMRTSREVVALG